MKNLEKVLKAFANRRRLVIIKYLKNHREASVGDISFAIKLSFRSTSKHLSVLAAADIIDKEQRGSQIFYKLADNLSLIAKNVIHII